MLIAQELDQSRVVSGFCLVCRLLKAEDSEEVVYSSCVLYQELSLLLFEPSLARGVHPSSSKWQRYKSSV